MIKSKNDLKYFIKQDKMALGIKTDIKFRITQFFSPNYIWSFQKLLRTLEYHLNCKHDFVSRIYTLYLRYRFKKKSLKLGFSIPPNVFGPGLAIVHYGTIVVNSASKIGANCRMHAGVNIGASGGETDAPQIGDNVYLAPGAKVYGKIKVANNCAISANAVVFKSFEEENILIAGNPARKIKQIDIKRIIKHID